MLSGPVDFDPLVATLPDQPPDAVQELALLDDQVNIALPPFETVLGPAVNLTVGAGAGGVVTETVTDWAAEPPAPVQLNV